MKHRNPLFLILFVPTLCACGPKLTLKAVKATQARVESTVTTTSAGTVTAEKQAVLGFGASGRITKISVKTGDLVKSGQLLAQLENEDFKTVFEDAGRELKRANELFAAGLVSRSALDDAKKGVEIARSNYDRTMIKAPFDGIVAEVNLELGELSQSTGAPGKAQLRLVDTKPRLVKGDIDEVDLSKVKIGTPARVKIQAAGGKWHPAVVQKVVPFVSTVKEKDRTSEIELRLTDPAAAQIPVGASADIELITDAKDSVLALPARVALGHGNARYVFRYVDGKVAKSQIQIGIGNYERIEVLSGVALGDIAVYPPDEVELKDGTKVKVELQPWP